MEPWIEVPAGRTPLQARGNSDYWPEHSQANALLDEVADYVKEKAAQVGRDRVPGLSNIEELRRGINTPGPGLKHSQSSPWTAIDDGPLDWLETVGQQWDRRKLAPHQKELREIQDVARQISDLLADATELDSLHRDYMLEVCDALANAARDADIYGEPATARLANELIGALEGFLPAGDDDTKRNLYHRLKMGVKPLITAITRDAAVAAITNTETVRALTDGLA